MAQLKNTTISDTGNLSLPAGTTAQRPGSPVAGMIRYNTTPSETEYYDGAAWRILSDSNPIATGGTVTDTVIGGVAYRIHTFTTTGNSTFTVTRGGEVEYLIVAGGGGGRNLPGGLGILGQGHDGSLANPSTSGTSGGMGGSGGGAGGLATTSGSVTTIPGPGRSIDITGTSIVYALGGTGGDGRTSAGDGPGGTNERGHGGGGGGLNRNGLSGGSGIVVIRYIEGYL